MDFGSAVGRASGVTTEELAEIRRWRQSDAFDETEKLVMEVAEAASRTPAEVTDELFERLRARFSPEQLVELAALIAAENYISRFNRVFGITSQGFMDERP